MEFSVAENYYHWTLYMHFFLLHKVEKDSSLYYTSQTQTIQTCFLELHELQYMKE